MTPEGSRGGENSFEFETGDDIRRSMVAIDVIGFRIEDLASRSNDDRSRLNRQLSLFFLEIDGFGRTEFLTDPAFPFGEKNTMDGVNGVLQRNCLGILDMDRLSLTQTRIIFIIDLYRAFLSTEATGDTLRRVHIPRMLHHLDFKISLLPRDAFHL
jgi:hypothetical protein